MKYFLTLFFIFILCFSVLQANEQTKFLADFIQGEYHLIGKAPDSEKTYYGKLTIKSKANHLVIERRINDKTINGTAALEKALAGEADVLRMRFTEEEQKFEATCLIDSDLDNYARMSCYLYSVNGNTDHPGLEALFIVQ